MNPIIIIIKQISRYNTSILDELICILLVIVCSSLFSFLYILLFSIYATFGVCMRMYALCKFTLYIYIYALAVFNTKTAIHTAAVDDDDVVCRSLFLSFAPASITLHCEVLGVCQERKGNTSMAFFLFSFFIVFFFVFSRAFLFTLPNMLPRLHRTNSMISFESN